MTTTPSTPSVVPTPPPTGRYVSLPTATAWVDDEAVGEARFLSDSPTEAEGRPFQTALRLLILDLDGTLVRPIIGTELGFPVHAADRRLIAGRLDALRAIRASGVALAIATNQGGASTGHGSPETIFPVVERFAREIGAAAAIACWSHPKATVEPQRFRVPHDLYRKPGYGMLAWLLEALDVPAPLAMYVGDRDEDRVAARKIAHLHYEDADSFFARVRALLHLPREAPDPDDDPEGWLAASTTG